MATRLYARLSVKKTAQLLGVTVQDIKDWHALEDAERAYTRSLTPAEKAIYDYDDEAPRCYAKWWRFFTEHPAYSKINQFESNGWGRLTLAVDLPSIFRVKYDHVSGHTSNKREIEAILTNSLAKFAAIPTTDEARETSETQFYWAQSGFGNWGYASALDDLKARNIRVKDINMLYWG